MWKVHGPYLRVGAGSRPPCGDGPCHLGGSDNGLMSQAERFADLWNDGRVVEALGEVAEGYTYTDTVMGGPFDRDQHIELMGKVLERFPDRRLVIERAWAVGSVEFVEYRWTGTDHESGEVLEREWLGVFEYDDLGRAVKQRHYQG